MFYVSKKVAIRFLLVVLFSVLLIQVLGSECQNNEEGMSVVQNRVHKSGQMTIYVTKPVIAPSSLYS